MGRCARETSGLTQCKAHRGFKGPKRVCYSSLNMASERAIKQTEKADFSKFNSDALAAKTQYGSGSVLSFLSRQESKATRTFPDRAFTKAIWYSHLSIC
jgi:hypothetical protein